MSALVDTSILIDYLRGHAGAGDLLERERAMDVLHASEITRIEVLAGTRPAQEADTRALLSTLVRHPVDADIAEAAGVLGRQWLPGHHTVDRADLAISATAVHTDARLLTRNVGHFPMFTDLKAPY